MADKWLDLHGLLAVARAVCVDEDRAMDTYHSMCDDENTLVYRWMLEPYLIEPGDPGEIRMAQYILDRGLV